MKLREYFLWHPSLAGLDFDRLGDEDTARLEVAFSEEEVFLALCELNGDKALRLDGSLSLFGSLAGIS